MGKIKIATTLFLLMTAKAWAGTAQDAFKQGNDAYAAGQFAQAAAQYETARAQGMNHWILDYDLGNAYFKTGAIGKAIASYTRAFHKNSRKPDVIYNLNLALTKSGDPLIPADALSALFWRLFYVLPINTLTAVTSILFIALCAAGILALRGRSPFRAETWLAAGCILIVAGLWFGLRVNDLERRQAVVITPSAEVRSGPNLSYAANFTIPEGRRVLILEEQEPVKGWLEIGVPKEGLKGWVPADSIEAV